VQQVLLNLLMNSLDAVTEVADRPREIHVRVDLESPATLRVSVEDTGVGIDPQQGERFFEAFHTTKPHGLGMGLSISRSIVEAHAGKIWAEANHPAGAKLIFTLPVLSHAA
jgi:signal transduction histidine kinase